MSERQVLLWQIGWLLRFYAYDRLWRDSHADEADDDDA